MMKTGDFSRTQPTVINVKKMTSDIGMEILHYNSEKNREKNRKKNRKKNWKENWEENWVIKWYLQQSKQPWRKEQVENALSNLPMGKDALYWFSTLNDLGQTVKKFYDTYEHRHTLDESFDNAPIILLNTFPETCLLISSWLGCVEIVRVLLDEGASLNTCDDNGRTPLHLAACTASVKVVEELLQRGADPNKPDITNKFTALHCAAAVGCVDSVKSLIRHKADVNYRQDVFDETPLYYAILNNAENCVGVLLQANACPDQKVGTISLLHMAVCLGYVNCINLLLSYKANIDVCTEHSKKTPLHYAARNGNAECTSSLLSHGADKEAKNCLGQTAMHLAVFMLSVKTMNVLIKEGVNVNAKDNKGRTPLHYAVEVKEDCKLVNGLIQAGALINEVDNEGYTPLHRAVLCENLPIVEILLLAGADVTARTTRGTTALNLVVQRTPSALPRFKESLDQRIKVHVGHLEDMDCILSLDFQRLVPEGRREMDLIFCLIEAGQNHLVKHVLCESYLHLKWLRIRKFFLLDLIFHLIFVALFTSYIGVIYLWDIMYLSRILFWPLIGFTFIHICKELFHVAHSISSYIRHWENWLQWSVILLSCTVLIWPMQHHAAALGILLAWIKLTIVVGHYMFDRYIQMFKKVSINYFKCFVAYLCLIIGYSLSFSVLRKNYKSFTNPLISVLKTVIMMSGELEFEDAFFDDKELIFPGTTHLILLSFVILVTVILTNLMVGLAVSDIQQIRKCADLDRLVRRAELIAYVENMLFSKVLDHAPMRIVKGCRKGALLLESYYWYFYIRPNDPQEKRLPQELIIEIFKVINKRRMKDAIVRNMQSQMYCQKCASKCTHMDSNYVNLSSNETDQQDLNKWMIELKKCLYNISTRMDNMNDKLENLTSS